MNLMHSFLKAFLISSAVAGLFAAIIGGAIYIRVEHFDIDTEALIIEPKPTVIYDVDGNVMAQFREERKDATHYSEIPQEVLDALVATEDRAFYEHPGINVKAIFRAAIVNVQSDSFSQGGSTLTQQLVKNVYLTPKKDIERKLEEAVMSTYLEKELSKNEIISSYLNHIFYGHRSYGIKSAVLTYFGQSLESFKEEDRITRITRAALLAGLPQAPSAYSPYLNPNDAMNRRNAVLHNMFEAEFITKEEYEKAIKQPFLVLEEPNDVHDDEKINYGEVVDYVLRETAITMGLSEGPIENVSPEEIEKAKYAGYSVYTSFDTDAYKILRANFKKDELFPPDGTDGTQTEAAVSVVNPTNGEIIAFTGGRDAPRFSEFSRAFGSYRQPGSSFKPLIAYGPAIESGKFNPWSLLLDDQGHNFGGGYHVKNFSGSQRGKITMVDAITISQNVPAVYLLDKVGIDYAKKYAERLGIRFGERDTKLPIALGGLDKGVNPLMMADAYQAYANGGYRVPAHIIKRIVNHDKEVVHEMDTELNEERRVIKSSTYKDMKFLLNSVVEKGTGTNAQIPDVFVAGKTGTTEYPGHPGRNKDIWFSGFTNSFTMSVWMGFDSTSPERNLGVTSWVAARMWGEIGKELVALYPPKDVKDDYEKPEEVKPEVEDMKIDVTFDEKTMSASLKWKKEDETVYKVFRNGDFIAKVDKGSSYVDEELEKGKNYQYFVVGYNQYSDFKTYQSNYVSIETPTPPKTKSPTLNVGEITDSEVYLEWETVDGASYTLMRDGESVYKGEKTVFVDKNVKDNTEYKYELFATVEKVDSKKSAKVIKTEKIMKEEEESENKKDSETEKEADANPKEDDKVNEE